MSVNAMNSPRRTCRRESAYPSIALRAVRKGCKRGKTREDRAAIGHLFYRSRHTIPPEGENGREGILVLRVNYIARRREALA